MSNLDAIVDDDTIYEVLSEINKLTKHKRLTENDDVPIDLNTQMTAFIRILFGEKGLNESGNDKIAWLKTKNPVDRSKIDLKQLNGFLSVYRNEIQTVITAAPAPVVSPVVSTAPAPASSTPTPLVSTAAPAPTYGLFEPPRYYGRSSLAPAPVPASSASPLPVTAPLPASSAPVPASSASASASASASPVTTPRSSVSSASPDTAPRASVSSASPDTTPRASVSYDSDSSDAMLDSDYKRVPKYSFDSSKMADINRRLAFQDKLTNMGFSFNSVLTYTLKHNEKDYDLDSAINYLLKENSDKRQENLFILNDVFGRNNMDLIYDKLNQAKGDLILAGELIAEALLPSTQPTSAPTSSVPTTKLEQKSIFDGKFFQYKETGLGCGRFALNNLLGGRYFTAVPQADFKSALAYTLIEIKGLIEKLNPNTIPEQSQMLDLQRLCKYLKMNNSETMDNCLSYELYDQSVITNALGLLGYTVKIAGGIGVSQIAKPTIDMLDSNTGMIVNLSAAHYISIRKHDNIYYLMDSENTKANEGSKEFISKLLNYDRNITFVVGPYDINTSKKTIILMKIQEYFTTEGADFDFDEHGEIRAELIKSITNLKNTNIINDLYSKEITNIPYDSLPGNMNEYKDNFVRLLTTP